MTEHDKISEARDRSPDDDSLRATIELCGQYDFDGTKEADYGVVCSNRKVAELCESVIALRAALASARADGAAEAFERAAMLTTTWTGGQESLAAAIRALAREAAK